jgi:hypothetical protein
MAFRNNFETDFVAFLDSAKMAYSDNTSSNTRPDLSVRNALTGFDDLIELKQKTAPYSLTNWGIPNSEIERSLLILDELTIRKGFWYGPHTFVCVRDDVTGKFFASSVLEIVLGQKVKRNRLLGTQVKGKWLINLKKWRSFDTIEDMYYAVRDMSLALPDICLKKLPCHNDELVASGGIERTEEHRAKDREALS